MRIAVEKADPEEGPTSGGILRLSENNNLESDLLLHYIHLYLSALILKISPGI